MTRSNFEVIRGHGLTFSGVVRNTDGSVRDITGDTLVWRIGSEDLRETLVTLSEGDGISVTDAVAGAYTINLSGSKTVGTRPGRYRHQGESADGEDVVGFVSGRFELKANLP